jgi:hypothetical protein
MSASRTRRKASEANDGNGELLALRLQVADSGPHASKILLLQEVETLLTVVPADAAAKAYRAAVVDENVLGKRILTARKETASQLIALHRIDPTKLLFPVLWRLWGVLLREPAPAGVLHQLACRCSYVWHLPLANAVTLN